MVFLKSNGRRVGMGERGSERGRGGGGIEGEGEGEKERETSLQMLIITNEFVTTNVN